MGKSTISTGPFSIAMLVHQRVTNKDWNLYIGHWESHGVLNNSLGSQQVILRFMWCFFFSGEAARFMRNRSRFLPARRLNGSIHRLSRWPWTHWCHTRSSTRRQSKRPRLNFLVLGRWMILQNTSKTSGLRIMMIEKIAPPWLNGYCNICHIIGDDIELLGIKWY